MKTKIAISLMLWGTFSFGQEKTHPIGTTAKPDDLKSYQVTNDNIHLLFVKKGKKNEVYSNYVFDKNLNLITETEEELDVEQVKSKNWSSGFGINAEAGGIIRDSVLSVENNALGKLVLMTGYIGWRSSINPMNNATITTQGFIYREKINVKDDENGRGLTMVGFQTDAPAEFFATGKSAGGGTMGRNVGFGGQKRVSSSSGDVIVVSVINTIGTKDKVTGEKIFGTEFKYLAQRYSAKTLEKIAETPFEFKYSSNKLYDQTATDGSNDMLLIFTPTHGSTKDYSNPNKNEYEYIRIGVDTKIKERIKFNSPYGRLNNLCIYNFGNETIIMGTSKVGNESKFASFVPFKQNDDQLVFIRIRNGEAPVVKATDIKSLGIQLSCFSANDAIQASGNQIWITGQQFMQKEGAPAIWGEIYAFCIATDGSIAKHLALPQIEKASEKASSPISLVQLNDGHLLWSAYEYTKKGNMYPKYAKINNGNPGSVVYPGNKQYVVNDKFLGYISPDKKELIYFGNTEDNKLFWLYKENL